MQNIVLMLDNKYENHLVVTELYINFFIIKIYLDMFSHLICLRIIYYNLLEVNRKVSSV